jgi:hypothetical protein
MKTKLILLFLIVHGLNFEIHCQSLRGYSPDYILDVRITNIIKDFYSTKGYSKVISVTFWIENYQSGKWTSPEVHFVVFPVKGLSSVLLRPPAFFTKLDSSIVLIHTGFESYISRNSSMMQNLIKTISPFILMDMDIISYEPFRVKLVNDRYVGEIDDFPYGMEYIFKGGNEIFSNRFETASSGHFNIRSIELEKMIIRK